MRGKRAIKRKIKPDERFKSIEVAKFINYVMKDGKKQKAISIVYNAIEELSKKVKNDDASAIDIFLQAIENVKPKVEVRSRRVGGANLQVPVPVNPDRQFTLASKWIIEVARANRKKTEFWESLYKELLNAYNKEGSAIKKKEEVHKMAESNKAFAQFA